MSARALEKKPIDNSFVPTFVIALQIVTKNCYSVVKHIVDEILFII